MWAEVEAAIAAAEGIGFSDARRQGVGGGCINNACRLDDGRHRYFVKTNRGQRLAMFEAEADGLARLRDCGALAAPRPVCHGLAGREAFLVLEWLELGHSGDAAELGRGLAEQHRAQGSRHGWHRDNYIGSTVQSNGWQSDWTAFYGERRLGFQASLLASDGGQRGLAEQVRRLIERLPALLAGHSPAPSLLHGDLWGGNYGFLADGRPVQFDPACYYGDREADLAMTELFGGFPEAFYAAYREAWPVGPGYALRRELYNLYHVLNHVNLFGGGYAGQAQRICQRLLSEAG